MKQLLSKASLFALLLLLGACSVSETDADSLSEGVETSVIAETSEVRPLESALQTLDDFIQKNYLSTKGSSFGQIENVAWYHREGSGTKSDHEEDIEAYIINFKDNGGFAVLGASQNLPDIIAVTESGTIDTTTLAVTFKRLEDSAPPMDDVDDSEERDNEDVGFYCEDDDDFYCEGPRPLDDTTRFVGSMIDNGLNPDNGHFGGSAGNNHGDGDSSGAGSGIGGSSKNEGCSPLMSYSWGQSSPYNDYCYRRNLVGKKKRAYTGCSNTALSMIMACNEYPKDYYANGVKVDWKRLKETFSISLDSIETKKQVALLMASNFYDVKKVAMKGYTLITPEQIKQRMKRLGYKNVEKFSAGNFSNEMLNATQKMLAKGLPVFISAIPKKWKHGHSWVIDGSSYSKGGEYLVHCNFGWKGVCNGFFSINCLNPSEADSYDSKWAEESKDSHEYTYSWHFRLISY